MSKIRINDLARELEVKSKTILDVLPEIGVTEKKTHSSSLEEHEAEKLRAHLRGGSEASVTSKPARPSRDGDEIKTKIDLSHISKPGDVLKAIISKQQPAPTAPARPAPPLAPVEAKAAAPVSPAAKAPAPPAPAAVPSKLVVPATGPRPTFTVPAPPSAPQVPAASTSAPPRPAAPPAPPAAPIAAGPPQPQAPAASRPTAPTRPQAPPPRMIVPQTGPRPVYKAPIRPAASSGAAARPAPGRPVPGQPIFQRPRPGAPSQRPSLRPGERRPMHPTRQSPAGARPLGVGPGLPPPGPARPGSRPGAPSRRPGQRYIPRGVKEGPMKGFVPPPRLTVSNEPLPITRSITITEGISVKDLAEKLGIRAKDLIARLLMRGVFATINQTLDAELASEMARFFGADTNVISFEEQAQKDVVDSATGEEGAAAEGVPRPPVVTIMGHVDHGKTTLLDAIRSTNVAGGEAGGITQHIGAYQVTSPLGSKITFIDTPGHAAFTSMRARGARVTDIVVLVVAADDGVMPQTVEAIHHAKAARVPMIVAINKIDKPDAKPERVRTELLQHEVQVESLGGDVLDVEVSATKKTNLDRLLETIGLQSEILELRADPNRPAEGTVIEAKLDRGRGPVATVLVQRGTLRLGDIVVAGAEWGRVRALVSDAGAAVENAAPSTPVEVLGFNGTPEAGDRLAVVQSEARAREVTAYRARQRRDKIAARATGMRGSLEQMMSQLKSAGRKDLALIIKADVQGSLEAVIGTIEKLATDEVGARVIHSGVGGITESDVTLAEASGVPIIGFNVRAHKEAREAAEHAGIELRYYNVIYDLVDDVKKAMSGLLAPTVRETMLGSAASLEIFKVSKVGNVAGCRVTDGTVERGANVRLIRDSVVVHEGKLSQLKRFKDDAREVIAGQECGMAFENYQDMKVGDVIECYRIETVQRSL